MRMIVHDFAIGGGGIKKKRYCVEGEVELRRDFQRDMLHASNCARTQRMGAAVAGTFIESGRCSASKVRVTRSSPLTGRAGAPPHSIASLLAADACAAEFAR